MYPANDTGVGTLTVTAAQVTASLATITLGFTPRYVRVFNQTNAALNVEHYDGMADGSSVDTAAASIVVNAAGSITLTEDGFTLGADIIDTENDVIRYIAIR